MTIGRQMHIADLYVVNLGLHGMQHGMVLNVRSNDVAHTQIAHRTMHSHIIGLGAPGSKKDLSRRCTNKRCHFPSCLLYVGPCLAAKTVGRRRITINTLHHVCHGPDHFRVHLRGGCVVEIDALQSVFY